MAAPLRDPSSPRRSAVAHQGPSGRLSEQGGIDQEAMIEAGLGLGIGSGKLASSCANGVIDARTAGAVAGICGHGGSRSRSAGRHRRMGLVMGIAHGWWLVRRIDQPLLPWVHHALGRWRAASWWP